MDRKLPEKDARRYRAMQNELKHHKTIKMEH